MKKEDFFEVLGELDDDIVNGAKTPIKKKVNWKVLGAIAACLALICAAVVYFLPANDKMTGQKTVGVADVAPMVYVNDMLYIQSSDQQGYPEYKDDFIYLGKIESVVASEGAPNENFQANDPIIGCEIYQYGENIVVHINGSYWLYVKYGKPEIDLNSITEQEKEMLYPTYKK